MFKLFCNFISQKKKIVRIFGTDHGYRKLKALKTEEEVAEFKEN